MPKAHTHVHTHTHSRHMDTRGHMRSHTHTHTWEHILSTQICTHRHMHTGTHIHTHRCLPSHEGTYTRPHAHTSYTLFLVLLGSLQTCRSLSRAPSSAHLKAATLKAPRQCDQSAQTSQDITPVFCENQFLVETETCFCYVSKGNFPSVRCTIYVT